MLLAKLHPHLRVKDVTNSVAVILDAIATTLSKGGRVEIRQFGSFQLNYRPSIIGRNPKSGESVEIPASYKPHFKAGKELRWRVNRSAKRSMNDKGQANNSALTNLPID